MRRLQARVVYIADHASASGKTRAVTHNGVVGDTYLAADQHWVVSPG
jgi:hypothetical protein